MNGSSRTWRIGVLAWIAGTVDAFAYLALGRVFVSHMTGNTGVLAISLAQRRFGEALHRGAAIPLFFAGAVCGAALVESGDEPRLVRRALLLEVALLVLFAATAWAGARPGGSPLLHVCSLVLVSGAMGIQNAALTHPSGQGTHTTHISGPLTDLAAEVARWIRPRLRRHCRPAMFARSAARVGGFSGGVLTGGVCYVLFPLAAPLAAAAVLAGVALSYR